MSNKETIIMLERLKIFIRSRMPTQYDIESDFQEGIIHALGVVDDAIDGVVIAYDTDHREVNN